MEVSGRPTESSNLVLEVSTDGEETSFSPPSSSSSSSSSSSVVACVVLALNLANSTLGAGVLGLPLVARDSGLAAAALLLLLCALWTDWTLSLLLRCHLASKCPTYEAIGELCFGRKGKWAVAIGIILINLGAIIAYLVIVGDLVAPLIPVDWMRDVVIAVTTAIAFPLCLVRGRLLAMVSAASVLLVLGFTIMVITQAAMGPLYPAEPIVVVRWSTRLIFSFGIIAFAYSCHTNLVPLADETKSQEPRFKFYSIHLAMALCTSLYVVVSACGYSYLRDHTISNYLEFFPSSDVAIAVFRCVLAASLICTLPLCVMPCVCSVHMMSGHDYPKIYSIGFLVLGMLVALLVPDVGVVFSLTGSVASALTSFIFPPLLYMSLSNIPFKSLQAIPYLTSACSGVLLAVLGVVSAALDIAKIRV